MSDALINKKSDSTHSFAFSFSAANRDTRNEMF